MTDAMSSDVQRIVNETKAIRWWLDEQIEKGRPDDEIYAELPYAVAFIKGHISEADLLSLAVGR